MSDALSFAVIDGQHVELLPARTVMSMFAMGGCEAGDGGTGGNGGAAQGGDQQQASVDALPRAASVSTS